MNVIDAPYSESDGQSLGLVEPSAGASTVCNLADQEVERGIYGIGIWRCSLQGNSVNRTNTHGLLKEEATDASSSATERLLRVVRERTIRWNTNRGLGWC